MEYNVPLIISFFIATLGETFIPGPTLAVVLDKGITGNRKALLELVAGISVANALWALLAVTGVYVSITWLSDIANPVLTHFGAAYLIYLASRRILNSTIQFIVSFDNEEGAHSEGNAFAVGFMTHFVNPLSMAYYVSIFGVATADQTKATTVALVLIAVLCDLIAYLIVGFIASNRTASFLKLPFFRLVTGVVLIYLVARVYTSAPEVNVPPKITPLIVVFMLVGFLCAALHEAYSQVVLRKHSNNTILWRIGKLWSIWFSVLALLNNSAAFSVEIRERTSFSQQDGAFRW